jgi:hypothetical protein
VGSYVFSFFLVFFGIVKEDVFDHWHYSEVLRYENTSFKYIMNV